MGSTDPLTVLQNYCVVHQSFGRVNIPTSFIQFRMVYQEWTQMYLATRDLIVSSVDWSQVDLIVSVEAMGLPLLAAVGDATGKPTVVVRKRSYGMEGETVLM